MTIKRLPFLHVGKQNILSILSIYESETF